MEILLVAGFIALCVYICFLFSLRDLLKKTGKHQVMAPNLVFVNIIPVVNIIFILHTIYSVSKSLKNKIDSYVSENGEWSQKKSDQFVHAAKLSHDSVCENIVQEIIVNKKDIADNINIIGVSWVIVSIVGVFPIPVIKLVASIASFILFIIFWSKLSTASNSLRLLDNIEDMIKKGLPDNEQNIDTSLPG